jgi:cell division protease FtsH
MGSKIKTLLIWIILVGFFLWLFMVIDGAGDADRPVVAFDTFRTWVKEGHVNDIRVIGDRILISLFDGGVYETMGPLDSDMLRLLGENAVFIQYGEPSKWGWWKSTFLPIAIPVLIILIAFIWILKRQGAGSGTASIMSLRKSTAQKVTEKSVTFADVGGCAEAKDLLGDVVGFLKDSKPWIAAGARLPRGVLLEGPTGCGKTLLARAVAGETDAAFYQLAASEFVEMFVGVGAARVRDLFDIAKKSLPAVIFIDEIDAVGRRRGSGVGSAHDEREQTLNQLLVCLDGFKNVDRLVVIAATNRPDILDKALLRPGRFDRRVRVPHLSREDRLEILMIHTRKKPLADDVDFERLADLTDGLNGADIENLANEAAVAAVRRARSDGGKPPKATLADFETILAPSADGRSLFSALDALLVESATQLAEPVGKILARLDLGPEGALEGEILWADAGYIKLRETETGRALILPKEKVIRIEAVAGAATIRREDVAPDPWTRSPGMA